MKMLDEFLYELILGDFRDEVENLINSFVADHSQWVYVDGEEGDYGIITYTHLGFVVCRYEDQGGDSGEYKFTGIGKKVLTSAVIAAISHRSINMEI